MLRHPRTSPENWVLRPATPLELLSVRSETSRAAQPPGAATLGMHHSIELVGERVKIRQPGGGIGR